MRLGRIVADVPSALAVAADALRGVLGDCAVEEIHVLHLDRSLRPLDQTMLGRGDPGLVELPVRALVRDALVLGTRALVLAHNHPGGDPAPSRADLAATRRIVDILRPLDIRLLDHMIFAGRQHYSFHAAGLL